MNRVLRRPMFRIGGVAEGITSGLDQTKLPASRPAYNRGRVVNPGGYAGEKEEYERMNKILLELDKFREKSIDELQDWWVEILPILKHNQDVFFGYTKKKTGKVTFFEEILS